MITVLDAAIRISGDVQLPAAQLNILTCLSQSEGILHGPGVKLPMNVQSSVKKIAKWLRVRYDKSIIPDHHACRHD